MRPRPVPAPCRDAYQRYLAALDGSDLADSTRAAYDGTVRRFLRWLPSGTDDVAAALTQPQMHQRAVDAFTAALPAPTGSLAQAVFCANALRDFARRLHLAPAYRAVPARYRHIHGTYAGALTASPLAPATAASNLDTVAAFLRWVEANGAARLPQQWDRATRAWLDCLAAAGSAPATILRRQAALRHCAALLRLPGRNPR